MQQPDFVHRNFDRVNWSACEFQMNFETWQPASLRCSELLVTK